MEETKKKTTVKPATKKTNKTALDKVVEGKRSFTFDSIEPEWTAVYEDEGNGTLTIKDNDGKSLVQALKENDYMQEFQNALSFIRGLDKNVIKSGLEFAKKNKHHTKDTNVKIISEENENNRGVALSYLVGEENKMEEQIFITDDVFYNAGYTATFID